MIFNIHEHRERDIIYLYLHENSFSSHISVKKLKKKRGFAAIMRKFDEFKLWWIIEELKFK